MTWISDESPSAFVVQAPFVRAIGWLAGDKPFPAGEVPSAFRDKLRAVVAHAAQAEATYHFGHFCGFHTCDLCPPKPREGKRLTGAHGLYNLAVPFANLLCVCPELIAHYVEKHTYRPPAPFVEAVLECPLPDDSLYADRAAPFLGRLAAFHERARRSNWFEKGMCAICNSWQYQLDPDAQAHHCGAALVHRERNPDWHPPRITRLVITGAAGAGKTAVADQVADRLTLWDFDGDDFHSLGNVARMRSGRPLEDADRAPSLDAMHDVLMAHATSGRSFVLACSALKAAYRERLSRGIDDLRIVHLRADRTLLTARLAARPAHFFPPSLLDSQLETLEEPTDALIVDAALPIETIVDRIVADCVA